MPEAADHEEASSTARTRILVGALERCAPGAPLQRLGNLLRSWAKRGRPYRGHVFKESEVEEALSRMCDEQRARSGVPPGQEALEREGRSSPSPRRKRSRGCSPEQEGNLQRVPPRSGDWSEILEAGVQRERKASKVDGRSPGGSTGARGAGAGTSVEVRDVAWPPEGVLAAAASVSGALGPRPLQLDAAQSLLRGLFGIAAKDPERCDVSIATLDGVEITAHRAVLAAVSDMLASRFEGHFRDATSGTVDATDFGAEVVHAAVKFAYLGRCRVRTSHLGALFLLADRWQFSSLSAAVQRSWKLVPAVCCMQMLGELETHSPIPVDMLTCIVAAVAETFKKAAEVLKSGTAGPLPGTAGPLPGTAGAAGAPLGEPGGGVSHAQVVLSWRFLHELDEVLSVLPQRQALQLSKWVSQEEELLRSSAIFFATALQALGTASPEDARLLCSGRFNSWLPEAVTLEVVQRLCLATGLADETGNERPWLRWAYTGHHFSLLWRLYSTLQQHHRTSGEEHSLPDSQVLPVPGPQASPQAQPRSLDFPRTLEAAFAASFVEELYNSGAAVQQWEELMLQAEAGEVGPFRQAEGALEESLSLLARLLGPRRRVPALSAQGLRWVLAAALASAPPAAVHISGSEHLAGRYVRRGGAKSGSFLREVAAGAVDGPPLVLQRSLRARGRSLRISWKGIPPGDLETARAEWKIQPVFDDAEADTPLALALDETEDPTQIKSCRWWLLREDGRFGSPGQGLMVNVVAVSPTVLRPCVEAVVDWARQGGCPERSLMELRGADAEALLAQVCTAAGIELGLGCEGECKSEVEGSQCDGTPAPATTQKTAEASSSAEVESRERGLQLDEDAQCKAKAAGFENIKVHGHGQEEARWTQSPGEEPSRRPPSTALSSRSCPDSCPGSCPGSCPAGEDPDPQTPPPRTPRWHLAPSPPGWPSAVAAATAPASPAARKLQSLEPTAQPPDSDAASTAQQQREGGAAASGAAAADQVAAAGVVEAVEAVEAVLAAKTEVERESWQEASRIVDEVSARVHEVMEQVRRATTKDEKKGLLSQKRMLESNPEYMEALKYLEEAEDAGAPESHRALS